MRINFTIEKKLGLWYANLDIDFFDITETNGTSRFIYMYIYR